MSESDFPDPRSGFVVTHFLVVFDQDRSREFYRTVFGAKVVLERDPVIMRMANSWLILNAGGGPTDDKPTVTLAPPADPDQASAFLNLRVADIAAVLRAVVGARRRVPDRAEGSWPGNPCVYPRPGRSPDRGRPDDVQAELRSAVPQPGDQGIRLLDGEPGQGGHGQCAAAAARKTT